MMYLGFVEKLQRRIVAELDQLDAIYNFDYGDEFEIALCEVLNGLLPAKYGVCRGHVVSRNGDTAGDDIIIYDVQNFPRLRGLGRGRLDRKELIPVEAVYAYIEAKHTLFLEGSGGQSASKAFEQVAKVKSIERPPRPLQEIISGSTFSNLTVRHGENLDRWNPMWGAIIARYVKAKPNGAELNALADINPLLSNSVPMHRASKAPDLAIFGKSVVYAPVEKVESDGRFINNARHFYQPGLIFQGTTVPETAFALGLISLMGALDRIWLGRFPYGEILNEHMTPPSQG